ncbi:MAG: hypothetical protein SVS85_02005, partial [Candidatus Nanohaloarchaea archaeon]|nr:hypothetical protein [Candidatus Nanohaloarchaea archaeon]
ENSGGPARNLTRDYLEDLSELIREGGDELQVELVGIIETDLYDSVTEEEADVLGTVDYSPESHGDPEEWLHVLQAVTAQGMKLQQERLYETLDIVDTMDSVFEDLAGTYRSLKEESEDLSAIDYLGDTTSDYVSSWDTTDGAAVIPSLFDLARQDADTFQSLADSFSHRDVTPQAVGQVKENAAEIVQDARETVNEMVDDYEFAETVDDLEGMYHRAPEAASQVESFRNVLPDTDSYRVEVEGRGAPEYAEEELEEAYGNLDAQPPGLDTPEQLEAN